jgi:hypothetical protein
MVVTSEVGRKQATASLELRNFSEKVHGEAYVACATAASYGSTYAPPAGYAPSITAVAYWTADAANPATFTFGGTCPSPDQGVQQLTLQVATTDGSVGESVVVLKRCAGARPSPCTP